MGATLSSGEISEIGTDILGAHAAAPRIIINATAAAWFFMGDWATAGGTASEGLETLARALRPLLRRFFGCRRKLAVEAEIDRHLAVVIGIVRRCRGHDCRTCHAGAAKEWKRLGELGIVQGGESLIAEGEGLTKARDKHLLFVGGRDLGTSGRLDAADRAAEVVIGLGKVNDDVAKAHLRRCRLESVFGRVELLGGGDEILCRFLGVVAKSGGNGICLGRGKARKEQYCDGGRAGAEMQWRYPWWSRIEFCTVCRLLSSEWGPPGFVDLAVDPQIINTHGRIATMADLDRMPAGGG